jgi:hypothetical protein
MGGTIRFNGPSDQEQPQHHTQNRQFLPRQLAHTYRNSTFYAVLQQGNECKAVPLSWGLLGPNAPVEIEVVAESWGFGAVDGFARHVILVGRSRNSLAEK